MVIVLTEGEIMRIFLKVVVFCVAALLLVACTAGSELTVEIYKNVD